MNAAAVEPAVHGASGGDAQRAPLRYAAAFVLALLVHLAAAIVILASETSMPSPPATPPEPVVDVVFEPEPPPEPEAPAATAPEDPADGDDAESREELIAFRSEGEREAVPDRPQGPVGEVHALPEAGGGRDEPSATVTGEVSSDDARPAAERVEPLDPVAPDPSPSEQPAPDAPAPEEPAPDRPALTEPEPAPESERLDAAEPADGARPRRPEPVPEDDGERIPEGAATRRPVPPVPPAPRPSPPPPSGGAPAPAGPGRQPLDFDGLEAGGFWNSDIRFDDPDLQRSNYSTEVYFAIYRAWLRELYGRVPRFERDQHALGLPALDGRVTIRFRIRADGSVGDLEILSPSPVPSLDEASSRALLRAVLPPLPEWYPHKETGVTFGFELIGFLSAQQLQFRLEMERRSGAF